jgi:uncharacterized DUF497 family protein
MKRFRWDSEKSRKLLEERDVSFEHVVIAIENGHLLAEYLHPNQERYPNQRILAVSLSEYVFLVPFVEDEQGYFLKSIIPSRKATRDFISSRS